MDPQRLEEYLYAHIPLSRAMGVQVSEADVLGVTLSAPLAPNINHRETIFGGSASAVAILAAWSLLHVRLQAAGLAARLVIQRNTMEYERPIPGAFTASAGVDPAAWARFLSILERRARARIAVTALLHCEGERVGSLVGEFVALDARIP